MLDTQVEDIVELQRLRHRHGWGTGTRIMTKFDRRQMRGSSIGGTPTTKSIAITCQFLEESWINVSLAHNAYWCDNVDHVQLITTSNEETFLQYFLDILKRPLQNIEKILMKCFLDSTRVADLTTHYRVTVSKGLINHLLTFCYPGEFPIDIVWRNGRTNRSHRFCYWREGEKVWEENNVSLVLYIMVIYIYITFILACGISENGEEFTSEFLENLEEMSPT